MWRRIDLIILLLLAGMIYGINSWSNQLLDESARLIQLAHQQAQQMSPVAQASTPSIPQANHLTEDDETMPTEPEPIDDPCWLHLEAKPGYEVVVVKVDHRPFSRDDGLIGDVTQGSDICIPYIRGQDYHIGWERIEQSTHEDTEWPNSEP